MRQSSSQIIKNILKNIAGNAGTLLILTLYCAFYIFISMNHMSIINVYKERMCLLDCYVLMMNSMPYMLMIVLPLIITFSYSTRHDFIALHITKYKCWRQLLKIQEMKILLYSVIYALIFMVLIAIITHLQVRELFNWRTEQSLFYMKTNITTNMKFSEILLLFFLLCVIRNFIIQNLFLLSLWRKNNILYGIIAVFVILFIEMNGHKTGLLFRMFSLDYYIWNNYRLRINMILGAIIYCLVISISFYYITANKELTDVKKI